MLVSYLNYYLIFIIIASLLIAAVILITRKFSLRILLAVIIALFISPFLIGYIYITYFTSIPEVVVPDLYGMELDEAAVKLELLGLKGKYAGSIFDMKISEGKIVSQSPEKGRKVKIGRTVSLITSSGRQKVQVPNLLGRLVVQAEAVLAAKGLRLGKVTKEIVPEVDPGIILTQNPLPGEEVDIGSWVTVTAADSGEVEAEEEKESKGGFKLW